MPRAGGAVSSLVPRSTVRLALAGDGQEMNQRYRGLGAKGGLRHAHLLVAVVHAPLHGDEPAGREPVGGPGGDTGARVLRLVEHRQVLHADALAFLAVAARAGEVPGAGALEIERSAEL